jgi:hypothetical protein
MKFSFDTLFSFMHHLFIVNKGITQKQHDFSEFN